jgi:hypothetical protein
VTTQTLVVAAVEVRRSKPKGNGTLVRRHGRYAGRIRLEVIRDRTAATLIPFVRGAVEPGAQIVTDGWGGYNGWLAWAIGTCRSP